MASLQMVLQDKKANMHIFAALMDNPSLMGNVKEYSLKIEDFHEKFHKIIFGAMYNLYSQGIEKITPVEVDQSLHEFPIQYRIFNDAGGVDYLYKLEEIGEPENFNMHYNTVKKYSLLRTCVANGINISDIFDNTIVDVKEAEKQQAIFNEMTVQDMIKHIENKLINIKDEFLFESSGKGSHMADNLREIIAEKMERPTYGANLNSGLYTAATRGARLRKVYLLSGASGTGKSRFALASMLAICVPEIWNKSTKSWIKTGATGRCLFVSTELEEDEIKIPALCYIADVEEDKLQNANLTNEEKARLQKAIEILELTPFWFEELHDFDLEDIEHVIAKNINKHNIQYVS